jgi:hypothetical protein
LQEIGSKEYCQNVLDEIYQEILKEAARIGPNPLLKMLMKQARIWDETKLSDIKNVQLT